LFATNLLAADLAAPLAAGKPAGVQKAEGMDIAPIWFVVGGVVALGAIVAAASSSKGATATTPPTTG
jgi:hypothetical protein